MTPHPVEAQRGHHREGSAPARRELIVNNKAWASAEVVRRETTPAVSSTLMCFDTAWREIGNSAASLLTVASP